MNFWLLQILNAVSLGALLFLVASGLSMIFGLMRIVNVAHGTFYMLGAYAAFEFLKRIGDQVIALVAAVIVMGLLGAVLQRGLIDRVKGDNLRQILMTFGLLLIFSDFALLFWQGTPVLLPTPRWLEGAIPFGNMNFPYYRAFVIVVGFALALGLDLMQQRTRLGSMIRAGADDLEMLSCMGVDVRRLFTLVFALGTALAGLGGALGGVFLGVYPGIDLELGILAFVVVIVGGLGSVRGTFAASLLVGLIDNLTKAFLPEVSMFAIFLLMVVVIAWKPSGLFGRKSIA
ncbi:MAG: branched-chain amino acid ABC transporter permease [Alphaproteobacteria bacterium]